jgi:hypothetical protein
MTEPKEPSGEFVVETENPDTEMVDDGMTAEPALPTPAELDDASEDDGSPAVDVTTSEGDPQ